MTIKQRLLEFLKSQKIGQRAFEARVGWSNGYISNTKEPSLTKLNMIFDEFPNLNKDWLINENGEMLNNSQSSNKGIINNNVQAQNIKQDNNISNSDLVDYLKEQIKQKDEQIDKLIALLSKE